MGGEKKSLVSTVHTYTTEHVFKQYVVECVIHIHVTDTVTYIFYVGNIIITRGSDIYVPCRSVRERDQN